MASRYQKYGGWLRWARYAHLVSAYAALVTGYLWIGRLGIYLDLGRFGVTAFPVFQVTGGLVVGAVVCGLVLGFFDLGPNASELLLLLEDQLINFRWLRGLVSNADVCIDKTISLYNHDRVVSLRRGLSPAVAAAAASVAAAAASPAGRAAGLALRVAVCCAAAYSAVLNCAPSNGLGEKYNAR